MTRLVYVMPADASGDLRSRLERWPTVPRTLGALARTERLEVFGLCATERTEPAFELDGVTYVPRTPRPPSGWARAAARLHPNVVHIQGVGSSRLALAIRASLGRNARIVVQHHGELPSAIRSTTLRRLADRAVDAYAFTGGAVQAKPFVDAGLVSRPVFDVLESSTDMFAPTRAAARSATGIDGSPAVLWVGRDTPGKDLETTLQAFAKLRVQRPAARLYLLQTEPIGRSFLPAGTVAVGPVPFAEMSAWYTAADCLVSTSRHEGSGYAVIEALACGTPLVVTDLPSFRAIAGDDTGTRYVPLGDHVATAEALQATAARPPARRRVRAAFDRRLSWDAVATGLLTAYGLTERPAI